MGEICVAVERRMMSRSSDYDSDGASSIDSRSSGSTRSDYSSVDANSLRSEQSSRPISPLDRIQLYFRALSVESRVPSSAHSSNSDLSINSTGALTNSLERFNARVAAAGQRDRVGAIQAAHLYSGRSDSSSTLVGSGEGSSARSFQAASGETTARSSIDESPRPPVMRRNSGGSPRRGR